MIAFSLLNKSEKALWLPQLFDLLYDNMRTITPSGLTYEQEKTQWFTNVSPALDKEPRQILMCFFGDNLAGYIQYYTRGQLLMVEEIQLKKAYQRTMVFYRFCKYFIASIPSDIVFVEAYADKRNLNSQRIMKKLGMAIIEETDASPFVHLRGSASKAKQVFDRY